MHSLELRLSRFRGRLRRLVAVRGFSRLVVVIVGSVLALGLADYVVRFEDPGMRVINSLVAVGLVGWAGYRYVWRALTVRLGDLRLAREVQRQVPGLDDRLATAIEFLRQPDDDPTAGSPALRRAVIAEAERETATLDFASLLDPRPATRSAIIAVMVVLIGAILATLDPVACRTAVARLARPLGSVAWPQRNHLELRRRVERIARGQSFEVEVVAAEGTSLPAEVRIQYRFTRPDGSTTVETDRMRRQGSAMFARRENVARPFSYRVEGGDDRSQPWIDLVVVEPPAVESLTVRLIPPDYTGWPAYESHRQIRALVGTRAEFHGRVTRPLASAALVLDERRSIPAELLGEREFRLPAENGPPIVLEHSGAYGLVLTDRQGIAETEAERFEIRVVPDGPPSASIEQPTGNVYVTPRGSVRLCVTAKDDLAVAAIDLVFSRGENVDAKSLRLSVYRGPKRPAPQPAFTPAPVLGPIDYRWELGPLNLPPRTAITYYVEAHDYAGAVGRSESRRVAVVSAEELLERLAERQATLASELSRVATLAKDSRVQVGAMAGRWDETGRLEQLDVDHLQAAAMGQRQAETSLTSRTEGVAMHASAILADVEDNRLEAPGITQRMQSLLAEIDRLAREHLPTIDQQLTTAIKSAQIRLAAADKHADRGDLKNALAETTRHQDQLLASLEQMLGQVAQWQNYRRFHRDLADVLRQQEDLNRATLDQGRQTIGRDLADLLPQQVAELKRLAARQLELSLRLEQWQDELRRAAAALGSSDPQAAETLNRASSEAARSAVGVRMRSVRAALEANRMGQASAGQTQLATDLSRLLDILSGSKPSSSAETAEKLEPAARSLLARQETLLDQTRQAADAPDQPAQVTQLAGRQQALTAETRDWVQRLGPDSPFGLVLDRAALHMQEAAERLAQRQPDQPTQQAQRAAVRRLAMLLTAMAPDAGTPPPAGQGTAPGSPGQRPGITLSLPQLKLLRLMQQDVLTRTEQLNRRGATDPDAARRYAELSSEQARLAELVLRLMNAEK
jgi:hypothetical protein